MKRDFPSTKGIEKIHNEKRRSFQNGGNTMKKRDFLSINDWSPQELKKILDLSARMKSNPDRYKNSLKGKSVALIFEKQSLRTHVTFDVGIYQSRRPFRLSNPV